MANVVKRTISVPADVFAALEAEASADESVSTLFSEGARLLLKRRAAERASAEFQRKYGAFTEEEIAEADRLLDSVGVGRRRLDIIDI